MTKKIIDINEGGYHLVCIHDNGRAVVNPYRVYAVVSAPGSPLRRRLLTKYCDFMSVIYFLRDFYLYGLNTFPVSEVQAWIKAHSA